MINFNNINQFKLDGAKRIDVTRVTFPLKPCKRAGALISGRLVSANKTGSALTLSYDATGRLFSSTLNGSTTQFLYDNNELVAEFSSTGTLLRRYVHGILDDDPVVWYEGSGTGNARYLLSNEQGSILTETSATGNVLSQHQYGPFGEPGNQSSSRFRYTGQILLPGTELYYYKARVYHPKLGRFMQTDPIGYEDGMNWYAYVGNDPVNNVDPLGNVTVVAARPLDIAVVGGRGAHTMTIVSTGKGDPIIYSSQNVNGENVVFKNHPSDVEALGKGAITDSIIIQPPEGVTSEQFDNSVIAQGEYMTTREPLDYSAIPALDGAVTPNKGNCHTTTTQLIYGAGGEIPSNFDPQGANPDLRNNRMVYDRPKR